jgi:DNA-binding transcriptional LysR family regulator
MAPPWPRGRAASTPISYAQRVASLNDAGRGLAGAAPVPFDDRLGPLRRREVDLVVTRLPLDQPDIVVGPLLSTGDRRVVMLGRTHPLADRADLSVEDLAGHDVRRPYGLTAEQAEATCPATTPSGRPIRFVDARIVDNAELLYLLARGRLVHPTVAPFVEHFQHLDVVAVPLRDLPSSTCALAGLRAVTDPNRDALLDIVEQLSTS